LIGGLKNREAVGAKITIKTADTTQFRQLRLGSNYLSNDPVIAYFGIAKNTKVDEIKIRWLDGTEKVFSNIAANQHLLIDKLGNIQIKEMKD
jgi:hypothetical protein